MNLTEDVELSNDVFRFVPRAPLAPGAHGTRDPYIVQFCTSKVKYDNLSLMHIYIIVSCIGYVWHRNYLLTGQMLVVSACGNNDGK